MEKDFDRTFEKHFTHRGGWLRAAVLGANDGIVSTASFIVGVSAAGSGRQAIGLAALASLIGGAVSMAAGEYISVSSQSDVEKADLEREKGELKLAPEKELSELAGFFERRGISQETAMEVAKQLTKKNALEAHAKEELGINDISIGHYP